MRLGFGQLGHLDGVHADVHVVVAVTVAVVRVFLDMAVAVGDRPVETVQQETVGVFAAHGVGVDGTSRVLKLPHVFSHKCCQIYNTNRTE